MRTRNITAAAVLLAFGAWYAYLTSHVTERTLPNTPGPSFFPWVLTALLLGLSGLLLVQGLTARAAGDEEKPESVFGGSLEPSYSLVLLFVYLLVLPYLGFVLATPFFFGALMWVAGERRPVWIGIFAVAFPTFLYLLFKNLFQIPLPLGTLLG